MSVPAGRNRRYVATLHNYQKVEGSADFLAAHNYWLAAEEETADGGPHLQIYGCLKHAKSKLAVVKLYEHDGFGHPHVDVAYGDAEHNIAYIKGPYEKDGKVKPANPFHYEHGSPPRDANEQGDEWETALRAAKVGRYTEISPKIQITQFSNLRMINAEAKAASDLWEPCGIYIFGPPGSGKSTRARSYGATYDKDASKWWDLFAGEENVCLDDLCPASANGLARYLKIWTDKYAFHGEIKGVQGGTGMIRPRRFIITSQYSLLELCKDAETARALERRCEIIQTWVDASLGYQSSSLPRSKPWTTPLAVAPGFNVVSNDSHAGTTSSAGPSTVVAPTARPLTRVPPLRLVPIVTQFEYPTVVGETPPPLSALSEAEWEEVFNREAML